MIYNYIIICFSTLLFNFYFAFFRVGGKKFYFINIKIKIFEKELKQK